MPIDKEDLKAAWAQGVASRDLAKRYGVTLRAVNMAAKALGLPGRPHASQRQRNGELREVSRDRDDKLLRALTLRNRGLSLAEIENRVRIPKASLGIDLNAIRKADLAESGERPRDVESKYWGRR